MMGSGWMAERVDGLDILMGRWVMGEWLSVWIVWVYSWDGG